MTTKAPRFRVGERLSASKQNQVSNAVNRLASPFNLGPRPSLALTAGQILVLEVDSIDHVNRTLSCIAPGTAIVPETAYYVVGLPQLFTELGRGSFVYTYPSNNINARTQTQPATEEQEITPNILVGDEIYAIVIGFRDNLEWFPGGRMWAAVTP